MGWDEAILKQRLDDASEDECLAWAQTEEQLEYVRKARRYPEEWVRYVIRNRKNWAEFFAQSTANLRIEVAPHLQVLAPK